MRPSSSSTFHGCPHVCMAVWALDVNGVRTNCWGIRTINFCKYGTGTLLRSPARDILNWLFTAQLLYWSQTTWWNVIELKTENWTEPGKRSKRTVLGNECLRIFCWTNRNTDSELVIVCSYLMMMWWFIELLAVLSLWMVNDGFRLLMAVLLVPTNTKLILCVERWWELFSRPSPNLLFSLEKLKHPMMLYLFDLPTQFLLIVIFIMTSSLSINNSTIRCTNSSAGECVLSVQRQRINRGSWARK